MNTFIILPLLQSNSAFSSILFWVMMAIAFFLLMSRNKSRLNKALDIGIKTGDEVLTVKGVRGNVVSVDDKNVSVRNTDGKTVECQLEDCIPTKLLIDNFRMVKITENGATLLLSLANKHYAFPLQTYAGRALMWIKAVLKSRVGVEIMIGFMFADLIMKMAGVASFMESGGRSFFEFDFVEDSLMPILITLGISVGCVMHFLGLYKMESLVGRDDEKAFTKIHRGIYLFVLAELVDFFPLSGLICTVLYVIGFVFFIIGYNKLRNSSMQDEIARSGYSLAFAASIVLLVGYILPVVGDFIMLIGYVMYGIAWLSKISKSSLIYKGVAEIVQAKYSEV